MSNLQAQGHSASFRLPHGLAIDANGNVYVADEWNHKIRKISPEGVVSTVAGSGLLGDSDGTGANASFAYPSSVAVDSSGNVFVADTWNHKIRKITPTGVVSTLAGSGSYDSTDGTNTEASFASPTGVAVDAIGNVYVADAGNNKIRKISPTGVVETLAGSGDEGSADGTDANASFYIPQAVAVDASGNVYVTDRNNHKIRKISPTGLVSTIAGSGSPDSTDGSGTVASFRGPHGIAIDSSGNLYVADTWNNKIRKISSNGIVTTLAGSDYEGSNDVAGTNPSFNNPRGVAIDSSGNVYVADTGNNKIRKISPSGVVRTMAGSGDEGSTDSPSGYSNLSNLYSFNIIAGFAPKVSTLAGSGLWGDSDGAGANASFYNPAGVAIDAIGNVYVADAGNNKIRKISPTGVVSTLAGAGSRLWGDSDGAGANASFYNPAGVAIDAIGNVYVADAGNNKVRKIRPNGVVSTLVGSGDKGSADGTGANASFNNPQGIAVDASGNLYVADAGNNKIRKISTTGIVATLAGSESEGSSDGTGTNASFRNPTGVAVDASGNVYVADTYNHKIRKISPDGVVSTLAGTGSKDSNDGTGTNASFNNPRGIAVDARGNIYVGDTDNHKIRKISPDGVVSTLAGIGSKGGFDGTGTNASFNNPQGIAVDASGNVYVANTWSNKIRKISTTGIVATLAGSSDGGSADGPSIGASFNNPRGIAVDARGNIYVADTVNNKIRKISPYGVVSTLAGSGSEGSADGTGTNASFRSPAGVAVDASGNVYVADSANHKIRKISPDGVVSTLAGIGTKGGFDGTGANASFNNPRGVAVDASGNVYVADSANHKIRKISPDGAVSSLAGGRLGSTNGTGTDAEFWIPQGVAVDGRGNVYVADFNYMIRVISPNGVVSTLAGSGSVGSTDGAGRLASFNNPQGVAVDASGNVYVADAGNHKIRKISTIGTVTTLAGSGYKGSSDGTVGNASFNNPTSVAVDASGNVYVAEADNNIIRKISPDEPFDVVGTLAGSGSVGSTDGTNVSLRYPRGVTIDASSNVYVADTFSNIIRKISPEGITATLAGSGFWGSSDGIGTNASFNNPQGIAVDASGNVYVADTWNNKIRKISTTGIVATLAGSGYEGSSDGTGTNASFRSPTGVAVDASGNVYVADSANHKIRKISPDGVVSTLAGTGSKGSNDGTGTNASFNNPQSVAIDSSGNVYVADTWNNKIRKISLTGVVNTLAGSGDEGSVDGPGIGASFNYPRGVAVAANGYVVVADTINCKIRSISPTGVVSSLAGTGNAGNADGIIASFSYPYGVAVDASGNVYVADTENHAIRKGKEMRYQTITFNPLTNITFTTKPITLNATASSRLPVTLSVISGPAAISGNTLTLTGLGEIVLSANQAGDANYLAAAEVTTSFSVAKPKPNITTKPVASAITFGQKLSLASLTGGVGSVPGTFAFTSPNATPNAGVATQSVTFTPTDKNYNSVTTTVSVTINKATPSITTKPVASSLTFGQKLSRATLTKGVASVPGAFAFASPNATPNAGSTTQSVTFTPTDKNYNSVSTTISVTVNKATPSITTKPVASSLPFGQKLSQATLTKGVASVPGTFAFSNPNLAPKLGKSTQTVLFSPTNANFNTVSFTIEINVVEQKEQKPAITAHPLSQTIADGGRLSLSVQATGGGLRYQWTKNGKNITGANLSTFTIAAASASDAGDYRVIVSNSKGSVASNAARITILAPEIDVQQPAGKSLVTSTSKISFGTAKTTSAGIRRTFTVRNTGTAKLTGFSFSKRGAHQNDFTVIQSNLREVAPGASAAFTVTFKPAAVGQRAASLRITSNDRDENPFIINLAGEGAR